MITLLLIVIFIAFIGLGVPDALFGTAWPAIYQEFNLPISTANCVTLLISCCTMFSSLFSDRVVNKFGTGKVTAFSTTMTALALLGFSYSGNIFWLCIFAIPLGFGAGAIDTALNNYVALYYKATHMNFLHCFYGVGVSLSPYLMSIALSSQTNWRFGYRFAFFIQGTIAFITILSLPLWGKIHKMRQQATLITSVDDTDTKEHQPRTLSLRQMSKVSSIRSVWLIFMAYCGIEFTCGTWGSTFLVNSKGMAVENAAKMITLFYVGLALGRFIAGIFANKLTSWKLLYVGFSILCLAIVTLTLPLPTFIAGFALFLAGFGCGPIFPNLIHLTPKNFGRDISQSVMGSQMAASYVGTMVMPFFFGFLAQSISTDIFPLFLSTLFIFMMVGVFTLVHSLKHANQY